MERDFHRDISDGRDAALIAGLVKPYIDNKIGSIVSSMVALYRNGETRNNELLGKAAEVAALMELMSELERAHRRGVAALDKEMKNAKVN